MGQFTYSKCKVASLLWLPLHSLGNLKIDKLAPLFNHVNFTPSEYLGDFMNTLSKSHLSKIKVWCQDFTHTSNDEQILTLLWLFGFWNLIHFHDIVFAL